MADNNNKKNYATEMNRIARIAAYFREEYAEIPRPDDKKGSSEVPLSQLQCFVEIAKSPGLTMKDLGSRMGISQSSSSRTVAALSAWHRLNKPGMNLVVTNEDPVERRRKVINLTAKGKRVAAKLFEIMEE